MKSVKASILFIVLLSIPLPLFAEAGKPEDADRYRFEVNANAFREGETIEIGVGTPALFQFKKGSRHYWSLFATVGLHTISNFTLVGETKVEEELFNVEAIAGIFAHGKFYGDFLYQYGKVAVDFVSYDSKINGSDDSAVGGLLESGLEFRSSFAKWGISDAEKPFAIHFGLRWRFGFEGIDGLQGEPDPIEGISFVIGTRLFF